MILITGANGYIGRHLAAHLGKSQVILTDIHKTSTFDRFVDFEYISANLNDLAELRSLFTSAEIQTVVHLSALKSVSQSIDSPNLYLNTNYLGTQNLFNLADDFGVRNFLFASSAAVYGSINRSPVQEDGILDPASPYGTSKMLAEEFLKTVSRKNLANVVSLRFFNVAGSAGSDLADTGQGNVFPIFLNAIDKQLPLRIFGSCYQTLDGTAVRDYIHVSDIVDGITDLIEFFSASSSDYSVFNFGSGQGTSVLELANLLLKQFNGSNEVFFEPPRVGDVSEMVADISHANKSFGYSPKLKLGDIISSLS